MKSGLTNQAQQTSERSALWSWYVNEESEMLHVPVFYLLLVWNILYQYTGSKRWWQLDLLWFWKLQAHLSVDVTSCLTSSEFLKIQLSEAYHGCQLMWKQLVLVAPKVLQLPWEKLKAACSYTTQVHFFDIAFIDLHLWMYITKWCVFSQEWFHCVLYDVVVKIEPAPPSTFSYHLLPFHQYCCLS